MAFTIIMQFIMQTCLIAGLGIMWLPIISTVAYENPIYDTANIQTQVIRDALWSFGIVLSVIAQGGNMIWFFKALKRQESVLE